MPRNSTRDSGSGPDHGTPLRVAVEESGSALVVHVAGEIDMNTAPTLNEWLATAFATAATENRTAVVVDFGDVEFLASVGLSVLVAHHQIGTAGGAAMHLVVSTRAVLRSITSAQLDQLFTLHPSVEDALAAVPSN
ncbi:MAG: STAS domain-containing protein [Umezawaea sp.]